jgi:murein DD-endopeptidase MepM/ murein hydrolase activator NlpD
VQLPIDPRVARVASAYGWRTLRGQQQWHSGIDFQAPEGSPVYAAADGSIVKVYEPGELNNYGRTIVLQHSTSPPLLTLYAHLQTATGAPPGAQVRAGDQIGTVGRTKGTRADPSLMFSSSAAHLHWEALEKWPAKPDQHRYDPIAALGLVLPTATSPAPRAAATAATGGAILLAALLWAYSRKDRRRPSDHLIGV